MCKIKAPLSTSIRPRCVNSYATRNVHTSVTAISYLLFSANRKLWNDIGHIYDCTDSHTNIHKYTNPSPTLHLISRHSSGLYTKVNTRLCIQKGTQSFIKQKLFHACLAMLSQGDKANTYHHCVLS